MHDIRGANGYDRAAQKIQYCGNGKSARYTYKARLQHGGLPMDRFHPTLSRTFMSQYDTAADAEFDGSPGAVLRFMREMAGLTGEGQSGASPVLELQFDRVLTMTSLSVTPPAPALCISVHLPRDPDLPGAAPGRDALTLEDGGELLWDAGEGRYVILHRIPIAGLTDERALFDAVLDAKDRALAWLAESGAAGQD
jgi:hypothetical protein